MTLQTFQNGKHPLQKKNPGIAYCNEHTVLLVFTESGLPLYQKTEFQTEAQLRLTGLFEGIIGSTDN